MTTTALTPQTILRAEPSELDELAQLREQLEAILSRVQTPRLIGPDGDAIDLPEAVFEALKLIVDAMARGQSLTLVPHNKELTTQEAADLLHVSRPHLIKLLDTGELPFHRVGTHRRIKIEDMLAYQQRRDETRKAALDELARVSEELPSGYR
jgi:excisionase family DNA binding protein